MALTSSSVALGIIGLGNMGSLHARNVRDGNIPGLHLAAVSDTDPARLEPFATVERHADWQELIRSPQVQAVLVVTPHFSHVPIGRAVLEAGRHLLMEKPLAVSRADCAQILSVPRQPGQVFALMFNQRGDPAFLKIREMIQNGVLGRIQRVQWTVTDWYRPEIYYQSGGWRATWAGEGGGVLVNQCPHNLDLYQWLFGMPQRVRGFCGFGRHHDIEVEDEATAIFEHPDFTGVFVTSTGEAPGVNRLEIAADHGRLVLESRQLVFHRNAVPAAQFSRTTREMFGRPEVEHVEIPLPAHLGEQHVGILKNFTAAIQDGRPLIAPGEEGIHSVELANAILLSACTQQTVDLPVADHDFGELMARLIRQSSRGRGRDTRFSSHFPS
jgi:predicted dehydrogenase